MVSDIKRKILVIGIGSIGFRHCQSLLNLSEIELHVVDIKRNNIQKISNFFKKSKKKNNKLFCYSSVSNICHSGETNINKQKFDLVIISTNSDVRFSIFKEITKKFIFKYIIFEKFVFSKKLEFLKTQSILKNKNITSWVNCPRRMQDIYIFIKNLLIKKKNKFHLFYEGSNWQMSSNLIHFIDIFCFLSSSENIKISDTNLATTIFKSKRKNFQDFFGELIFYNKKGNTLTIINSKKKINTKFFIKCNEDLINIDEKSGIISINGKLKKFSILKQSQLSQIFAKNIFNKKKILLATFEKSKFYHLFILNIFQNFYNQNSIKIT
jgi:hypothetical protein